MNVDAAAVFQCLGEEIRLRILALLLTEELCVCDLVGALQLPQSTVSRHLAQLKKCGWIRDRREGVWIYYAISPELPPLQEGLLPLLRAVFAEATDMAPDRERLEQVGRGNRCA